MLESMYLGYRKFKDKFVPYKLTVATKEIKMLGQTHTTDHWLIWPDYVQIYEILDELIAEDSVKHKYVSTRPDPKWQRSIVREVPKTNIRLAVTVEKREPELIKLLKIDERHAYKMQFVLKVTDNLATFRAGECAAVNGAAVPVEENSPDVAACSDVYTPESAESSPSYKPRAKTDERRRKDMQEYVPKASTVSTAPQSPYVPSKISQQSANTSDSTIEDQYSPKPVTEAILVDSSLNSGSDDERANKRPTPYTPTPRKSQRKITRKAVSEELDENGLLDMRGALSKVSSPEVGVSRKRLHHVTTAKTDENESPPLPVGFTTPTSKKTRIRASQSSSSDEKATKNCSQGSNKSVNLFGSDDSEEELPKKPEPSKNLYEKYKITDPDETEPAPSGGSKPAKKKEKENSENAQMRNSIGSWLSKSIADKEEEVAVTKKVSASTSGKPSKSSKDKMPKIFKRPKPKKVDAEILKKLRDEKERMVKARQQLDDLKSAFNATQEPVEILTLKMLGEEIIDTFDEIETRLTNLLEEYKDCNNFKKVKIFGHLTPADINAHCTTDQTYEMIKFLNHKYNQPDNVGRYETMFTELLLPEWVIGAFMRMHSMSRDETLSYMDRQRNMLCNEELEMTLGF